MDKKLMSQSQKKASKAALELYRLNEKFKIDEEYYKKQKDFLQSIIRKYTEENDVDAFSFSDSKNSYQVRPIINKKITWDIDKLSKKLDKEILNEVVQKTYTINDLEGLVKYLKSCGVDPKKFKTFIDVTKTVDNKKIDELGQLGDIDIEDLSGCYELQANFSYVRINAQELEL